MILPTLSIRQPWAGFIMLGKKPVENRTWKNDTIGPILIHAGKSPMYGVPEEYYRACGVNDLGASQMRVFLKGCMLGVVFKGNCINGSGEPPTMWHDRDQWWWNLSHPVMFMEPFESKGRLGLYDFEIEDNTPLVGDRFPVLADYVQHFKKQTFKPARRYQRF